MSFRRCLGSERRLADYPLIDFHATSPENVQLVRTHACLAGTADAFPVWAKSMNMRLFGQIGMAP
jgi:hypothetical protein